MMPNLTKFGSRLEVKFGVIMTLLCIFIQTVFREDIRRYYDIIMYFYSDSIHKGFQHNAAHTPVMIRMEDDIDACVTQTHAAPSFLVLYHQNVALNGECVREYGRQTSNEPL